MFNKYQIVFSSSILFYFFIIRKKLKLKYFSKDNKDLIDTGSIELENQLIIGDYYFIKEIFKSVLFGSLNTSLFICVNKFIIPKINFKLK
jgi:hypothetical protein